MFKRTILFLCFIPVLEGANSEEYLRMYGRDSTYTTIYRNCILDKNEYWSGKWPRVVIDETYHRSCMQKTMDITSWILENTLVKCMAPLDTFLVKMAETEKKHEGVEEDRLEKGEGGISGEYRAILDSLLQVKREARLSDEQTICLLKCASSHSLTYVSLSSLLKSSPEELISRRQGNCRDYSELASDMGKALGLKIYNAYVSDHAFNIVELRGKKYYLEPQLNDCTLMQFR